MDISIVKFQQLNHAKGLPPPSYMTSGAAAVDLRAANVDLLTIPPGSSKLIPTGIALQLPPSVKAEIRGRSGLALNWGIQAHNGLIDPDYLGEIFVLLFNLGTE